LRGFAIQEDKPDARALVSRNGTLVYVAGKARKMILTWLDSSGQTRPLRPSPADYEPRVQFAPDGTRLAFSLEERGNDDLWVYDWERDKGACAD